MNLATSITSLVINYPDFYLIGLRKVLDKNKELYLKLIRVDGNININNNNQGSNLNFTSRSHNFLNNSNPNRKFELDLEFENNTKALREDVEESYRQFFKFLIKEDMIVFKLVTTIKSFFSSIGNVDYQFPGGSYENFERIVNNDIDVDNYIRPICFIT